MQILTHVLSGWCVGNCLPLTPRERLCCMIAASVADVDGVGLAAAVFNPDLGQELYWRFHHVIAHNLTFGVLVCFAMALISTRRWLAFAVYLGLFHLHLLMDYYGSGPCWGITYWWPFSPHLYTSYQAWEFNSWQNNLVLGLLALWTIGIAVAYRRTPLEALAPRLDQRLAGRRATAA